MSRAWRSISGDDLIQLFVKPLHIVQIGYDDSVFAPNAPSDTRLRQRLYAELLVEKRPDSRMTVVALTTRPDLEPLSDGPVRFVPVAGQGAGRVLSLFRQLLALSAEQKIDVIATQTIFTDAWVALAVGRLIGAKVVGQIHFDIFSPQAQVENSGGAFQGRWRMAIAWKALRYLDLVRVTARRLRAELLARRLHTNVTVLPVPVTMPATLIDVAPHPPRVLYVGRLVEAKNLRSWLQVAQRISQQQPDVEFEWAGDGPLRVELLAEAERLGIAKRLHWLGAVPYEQLPAVYSRATVFLFTSSHEGFGRVLVEAGLYRLPVVASRITGVEDIIVDGETGFLIALDDELAMAEAALRLLRDSRLCAQMGIAAQSRVRCEFDPQQLAERWVVLLISVAEENHDFAGS